LFRLLFPYKTNPHEVWVYKGKIIGITFGAYVNSANIDAILEGRKPNLPLKYDFYKFNADQPLFYTDTNLVNKKTITYAAISGFRRKVDSYGGVIFGRISRNKQDGTFRFFYINCPTLGIYVMLFNELNKLENNHQGTIPAAKIAWEVADRSKYRYIPELGISYDWTMANAICFESVQPDHGQSDADVYRSVIHDMNRLLGLNVRWEKRKETVYVIKDKPDETYRPGSVVFELAENIGSIAGDWNTHDGNPYMFDETTVPDSIKNNVSSPQHEIDITAHEWTNFDALKKKLNQHGLDLIKEERVIDKLVFTEQGYKKAKDGI